MPLMAVNQLLAVNLLLAVKQAHLANGVANENTHTDVCPGHCPSRGPARAAY
ncbi:MAG: hypothetical protein ACI9GW_002026, partial [Halieaceae bacterium]